MRKITDLSKKIRDTKGTFHARMGTIKDRNGKDLTEAEYIRKRWQEYIEKLYRNSLITQITMMVWSLPRAIHPGVWSQVGLRKHYWEQSLWRWWIPAELFQILKDDAVKVLHSVCQQVWKTQPQWPQGWKRSVFITISKKGNAKNVQPAAQLCSFYMLINWCSKFFKLGCSSMWT